MVAYRQPWSHVENNTVFFASLLKEELKVRIGTFTEWTELAGKQNLVDFVANPIRTLIKTVPNYGLVWAFRLLQRSLQAIAWQSWEHFGFETKWQLK